MINISDPRCFHSAKRFLDVCVVKFHHKFFSVWRSENIDINTITLLTVAMGHDKQITIKSSIKEVVHGNLIY